LPKRPAPHTAAGEAAAKAGIHYRHAHIRIEVLDHAAEPGILDVRLLGRRILSRRKLVEVVDAHGPLKTGDALGHFLKSVFTEALLFFLLELLGHRIVFVSRDDAAQFRE